MCSGAATGKVFNSSNNPESRPSNFLFQIARGSGATLSECTFSSKNRTSQKRLLQGRPLQDLTTKRTRTEPYPSSFLPSMKKEIKTRSSSSLCQRARGSGATPRWMNFFQKSTQHSKIQRSATWFHSRKHSDDPCSYSTRGTRRGF